MMTLSDSIDVLRRAQQLRERGVSPVINEVGHLYLEGSLIAVRAEVWLAVIAMKRGAEPRK